MQRITFGLCLLYLIISISCTSAEAYTSTESYIISTAEVFLPLPELSSHDVVINKIKQNLPEIEKYFLFDRTGELIVKADLVEVNTETGKEEYFQALYNLKQIVIENTGEYLIPFSVKCLVTGDVKEDNLLWKPQKDETGILFSFDDHYFEVWERYFDLFDRYNAVVTFFVLGRYNRFSAEAIRRGHDVGYHTLTHPMLPDVSRQTFLTETISQVKNFRDNGVPLVSFAYPYGFYETWMHEELLKTFTILRGFNINFQVYDRLAIKNSLIHSKSVDAYYFEHDDDFMSAIDLMFRTLKFLGQGLVFPLSSHIISDRAEWGIKAFRLEYLLQTANDLQLNFYRYSDFR